MVAALTDSGLKSLAMGVALTLCFAASCSATARNAASDRAASTRS